MSAVRAGALRARRCRPLPRCWADLLRTMYTAPQDPNKELLKLHQKHGGVFALPHCAKCWTPSLTCI